MPKPEKKTKQIAELYEKYKAQGNADVKAQKWEGAIRWYTEALKHADAVAPSAGPQNARAILLSNRSMAALKLSKFGDALSDGEECVKEAPQWVKGYFRVGEVLRHVGKYPEAEAYFETAAKIDPSDPGLQGYLREASTKAQIQMTSEYIHPLERSLGLTTDTVWSGRCSLGGLFFGCLVVALDSIQTNSTLSNAVIQASAVLGLALVGGVLGFGVHIMKASLKADQLETPAQVCLDF